jgi:hypothetical protein
VLQDEAQCPPLTPTSLSAVTWFRAVHFLGLQLVLVVCRKCSCFILADGIRKSKR